MRKLKLLFVALLSSLCCFAFAGCEIVSLAFIGVQVAVQQALDDTPSLEERRLSVEITEGATITEITQGEDGFYEVTVRGAIKNLGDKDAGEVSYYISYYDEYGYLLDCVFFTGSYLGAGETCRVNNTYSLFYRPETARIHTVEMYVGYEEDWDKQERENVEVLPGESFACTVGEDGKYYTEITGQVKLLPEMDRTVYVLVALYDAEGYTHLCSWSKTVTGPAERTYTMEYTSDVEIVSYKVLYGTTGGVYDFTLLY